MATKVPSLDYLAAAVDGEGCITFSRARAKGIADWLYKITLIVTNTKKPWLQWIQAQIGGVLRKGTVTRAQKQGWRLVLCGNEARAVIETLEPFLFIKQKQARLALRFTAMPRGVHPMTEKLRAQRLRDLKLMQQLNHKGD